MRPVLPRRLARSARASIAELRATGAAARSAVRVTGWARVTLVGVGILTGVSSVAHAAGPSLIYDLSAWHESVPALAQAWAARDGDDAARAAAIARLDELLGPATQGEPGGVGSATAGPRAPAPDSHAPGERRDPLAEGSGDERDPLVGHAALWLRGDLRHRAGDHAGFRADLAALEQAQSGLADELKRAAAEAEVVAGRPLEAARLLLSVTPGTDGHVTGCQAAADLLRDAGEAGRAAAAVTALLARPLSPWAQTQLTLLAARLDAEAGAKDKATALLTQLWWTAADDGGRERAAEALKSLGRPVTLAQDLARRSIRATRRDLGALQRLLKRHRRASDRTLRRVAAWGEAVLERFDADRREAAVTQARSLAKKLATTSAGPWAAFGHALTLRRLDRDLEAVEVYRKLADRWPEHVLVPEALGAAAELLELHGLPADAAELDARVVAMQRRGDAERQSLWRMGFGEHLRGELGAARTHLLRLVERYGADQDGLGVTWAERAGYWLARTNERDGRVAQAIRGYTELAVRFPLGWYALLATQRREDLLSQPDPPLVASAWAAAGPLLASAVDPPIGAPPAADEPRALDDLKVVRRPVLDRPVALIKLGAEALATHELEALHASGQLPGSGRALLAALYRRAGDAAKAASLLRRRQVLAEVPGPEDVETYAAAYPFAHGELIEQEAEAHGLPPALLAGLIHIESRYDPKAVSGSGAIGLTQLMIRTARTVSKKLYGKTVTRRGLRDPATNVSIGAGLLGGLLDHFQGNVAVAVAAYNGGRGAARGWLRQRAHLETDAFVETIPRDQPRRYTMRVIAVSEIYRRLHGVKGPRVRVPWELPLALGPFLELPEESDDAGSEADGDSAGADALEPATP